MAKKPKVETNVFAKTDEPDPEKVYPRGVGLKRSEWVDFDAIAAELGLKPHALAVYALRRFVEEYRAGNIPTTTGKRLG